MTGGLAREIICFRMLNKISRGAVHRLERVHDGSHILRLPVCHVVKLTYVAVHMFCPGVLIRGFSQNLLECCVCLAWVTAV